MLEKFEGEGEFLMGVDTGKDLHVVILRDSPDNPGREHLVHLAVCQDFVDLDAAMERFKVTCCVIDGLPETHATRDFAGPAPGHRVHELLRGQPARSLRWDHQEQIVQGNLTEVLDASRAAVRHKRVVLPRRVPIVELFTQTHGG